MPIGLAAGLMIAGTVAKAGTDIYMAKKGSDAAKKASSQQVAATDQAMAVAKAERDAAMQRLNPYIQMGQQAHETLGTLLNPRPFAAFNPNSPAPQAPPAANGGSFMPQRGGQPPAPYRLDELGMTGRPMNAEGFGVPPQQSGPNGQGGQPRPGEMRMIQGRQARWDGRGWKAVA